MGTSLVKRVALGAHVVGEGPVLLSGTCHPDTLTQGLSSCPQILELLCQILQTDSLNAIQFWLLHAPVKGEDAMPRAFSDWKLWRALFSGGHSAPTRAFPLGCCFFLESQTNLSSRTVPLLPPPPLSARIYTTLLLRGDFGLTTALGTGEGEVQRRLQQTRPLTPHHGKHAHTDTTCAQGHRNGRTRIHWDGGQKV